MAKPYLIMLPGWGMNSFVWNKISESLAKDFELIFIEWNNIISLNEFKERVIKVIEQRQISEFSMLGWSLGSLVALDIASDNLWNVKNIILVGCTSSFIQHEENKYNIGWKRKIVERMKSKLCKSPQETLNNFYDAMFSKEEKYKGYNNEFLKTSESDTKNQSIDSLLLGLDYLIQKDLRAKLPHITAPLLIIQGEDDNICPLDGAKYIKNMSRNSNIEIVKKAGHIPFFTNPSAFYSAISKFILENI